MVGETCNDPEKCETNVVPMLVKFPSICLPMSANYYSEIVKLLQRKVPTGRITFDFVLHLLFFVVFCFCFCFFSPPIIDEWWD